MNGNIDVWPSGGPDIQEVLPNISEGFDKMNVMKTRRRLLWGEW